MGGGKGSKSKAYVYGEMPEFEQYGKQFADISRNWLQGLNAPGLQELARLAGAGTNVAMPGYARMSEVLSPEWLTQRPAGMQSLFDVWGQRAKQTEADLARDTAMRFGAAGQAWSSPMAAALMRSQQETQQGLQERMGAAEMQDYEARRAQQLGMIPQATAGAQAGAQTYYQSVMDLLMNLLRYAQAGRGQMSVSEGQSGGGILSTLLGLASGAAGLGWKPLGK